MKLCKNKGIADTEKAIGWNERRKSMSKTNGKKMDKMVLLLIPLAVAINMVAYNVIYPVTMVVIGDSIGTILVGATCGPVAGLLVGLLSNLVNVIKNPVMIVMAPLNMAFGALAGYMAKKGMFKKIWKTLLWTPAFGFIGGWLSGTIIFFAMGGDFWGNIASVILGIPMYNAGVPKYLAMAIGQLCFDCIDKFVVLLVVFLVIKALPDRFLVKLPYGKYVTDAKVEEVDLD